MSLPVYTDYGGDPYTTQGGNTGYNPMVQQAEAARLARALREAEAVRGAGMNQIFNSPAGSYGGTSRYQHYVRNVGGPLQGVAEYMAGNYMANKAAADQVAGLQAGQNANLRDLGAAMSGQQVAPPPAAAPAQAPMQPLTTSQQSKLPMTMAALDTDVPIGEAPDQNPQQGDMVSSEEADEGDVSPDSAQEEEEESADETEPDEDTDDTAIPDEEHSEAGTKQPAGEETAEADTGQFTDATADTSGAPPGNAGAPTTGPVEGVPTTVTQVPGVGTQSTSIPQQLQPGFTARQQQQLKMMTQFPQVAQALQHQYGTEAAQEAKLRTAMASPQKAINLGRGLVYYPGTGKIVQAGGYEESLNRAGQMKMLQQQQKATDQQELEKLREAGRVNTREAREKLLAEANDARSKSDAIKLQIAKMTSGARLEAAKLTAGAKGQAGTNWFKVPADLRKGWTEATANIAKTTDAINQLKQYPNAVGLKGFLPSWSLSRIDPQGVGPRAAIADLSTKILHDLSGAAITEHEFKRLAPLVPTADDSYAAAMSKLQRFQKEYNSIRGRYEDQIRGGGAEPPTLNQLGYTSTPSSGSNPDVDAVLKKYNLRK